MLVHPGGGGDAGLTLGGICVGLLRAGFWFFRRSPFRMFNRTSSHFPLVLPPPHFLICPITASAVSLGTGTVHCLFAAAWAPGDYASERLTVRRGRVNAPQFS